MTRSPEAGDDQAAEPKIPIRLPNSAGVLIAQGGQSTQNNYFTGSGGQPVLPATETEFRSDLIDLLTKLERAARTGHLPAYLQSGADVAQMARTVRVLGRVRRTTERTDLSDIVELRKQPIVRATADPDTLYSLPADDDRSDEAPQTWEKVVADHDRLVVLADPGMGKSWLIRTETHRLAAAALDALRQPDRLLTGLPLPLPVRADLLAGLEGHGLPAALASHFADQRLLPARSQEAFAGVVAAGSVVLLIDALDELPHDSDSRGPAARKRLEDLLRGWVQDHPGAARCVLTTRLAGYAGAPVPDAKEVELLPFSADDVRTAIRAWDLPRTATERIASHLVKPGVSSMARVPLLLALLCSLAAELPDQESLPSTRTALYRLVTWRFLSAEHRTADPGGRVAPTAPATRENLLRVLSDIALAFASTPGGWADRMPQAAILRNITSSGDPFIALGRSPSDVLELLAERAGVLVPAGNPHLREQPYVFLHRTFAEYLVARRLRDLDPVRRMELVEQHQWFDPAWAEVIPMLGGLLASDPATDDQATDLARHFLRRGPDLLFRRLRTGLSILGEVPDPDSMLRPEAQAELIRRVDIALSTPAAVPGVARAISRMPRWPQFLTRYVLRLLDRSDHRLRQSGVRLLASRNDPDSLQKAMNCLYDPVQPVRAEVIAAIAALDLPGISETLRVASQHPNLGVMVSALDGLAKRDIAFVTDVLLGRAPVTAWDLPHGQLNVYRFLRKRAPVLVEGEGQEWVHRPDLIFLDLLLALSGTHHFGEVLSNAATLSPRLAGALQERLTDESDQIRAAACEVCTSIGGTDMLGAVIGHIDDPSSYVRSRIYQALRTADDPDLPDALKAAFTTGSAEVRSAIVSLLLTREDHALLVTLGPLLDVLPAESSHWIQEFRTFRKMPTDVDGMIESLATADHDSALELIPLLARQADPRALEALAGQLGKGRPRQVRLAAAIALAGYGDDRALVPLLSALATAGEEHRQKASRALLNLNDPSILMTSAASGIWMLQPHRCAERYDLADQIADQQYLSLPGSRARDRVRRGWLASRGSRRSLPASGQPLAASTGPWSGDLPRRNPLAGCRVP